MTNAQDEETRACIYQDVCGACTGVPTAFNVHLRSGEVIRVEGVIGVELTQEEITLRRGEGIVTAFRRRDVHFAGCARCIPPVLY